MQNIYKHYVAGYCFWDSLNHQIMNLENTPPPTLHPISLAVLLNVHIKITWLGSANVLIKYFKFTGARPTSLSPLHWDKGHLLYMSAVTMTLHSPE